MVSVFQFIMKQSYICALIAMMVCMRGDSRNAPQMPPQPSRGWHQILISLMSQWGMVGLFLFFLGSSYYRLQNPVLFYLTSF